MLKKTEEDMTVLRLTFGAIQAFKDGDYLAVEGSAFETLGPDISAFIPQPIGAAWDLLEKMQPYIRDTFRRKPFEVFLCFGQTVVIILVPLNHSFDPNGPPFDIPTELSSPSLLARTIWHQLKMGLSEKSQAKEKATALQSDDAIQRANHKNFQKALCGIQKAQEDGVNFKQLDADDDASQLLPIIPRPPVDLIEVVVKDIMLNKEACPRTPYGYLYKNLFVVTDLSDDEKALIESGQQVKICVRPTSKKISLKVYKPVRAKT